MSDTKASCPVGTRLLPAYLTGKLTGTPTEEEFKEHVRTCEDCKALVADPRKAMQVLIASAETTLTEGAPGNPAKPSLTYPLGPLGLKIFPWKLLAGVSAGAISLIALTYVLGHQISIFGYPADEKLSSANPSPTPSHPEGASLKTEKTTSTSAVHTAEKERPAEDLKPPTSRLKQPQGTKSIITNSSIKKNTPRSAVPSKSSRRSLQATSVKPSLPTPRAPKTSPDSPKPQARVEVTDETGKRIGETIIPNQKESTL